MSEYDHERQGRMFEGWAFTFCKAGFLVLLFGRFSLLALSGLATMFYLLAAWRGVQEYRCWAKPPWVTLFWAVVFIGDFYFLFLR
jgi:hypothetical protein